MTLSDLYLKFSEAKEWQRLAVAMRMRVNEIILKPHGNTEADTFTPEMLALWLNESGLPPQDTVPTESTITHMMIWSHLWREQVMKPKAKQEPKQKPNPNPKQKPNPKPKPKPKPKQKLKPKQKPQKKAEPKPAPLPEPTPQPKAKVYSKHPKRGEFQQPRRQADIAMTMEEWQKDTRPRHGTISYDTASGGWRGDRRTFKDRWKAAIMVNGQQYSKRAATRRECREWLNAVLQKKILPTDNKADWLRMEQRKDEEARIEEIVISQAEEAVMLCDYHHDGDLSKISDYVEKRLLPHMMYYCAHTLNLDKESTVIASRQAAGLLLTRITSRRPVHNFTYTCKRMLRTYKQRGNFFYYEKAPEPVKLIVNGINFDRLAEVWKVTKDRRI